MRAKRHNWPSARDNLGRLLVLIPEGSQPLTVNPSQGSLTPQAPIHRENPQRASRERLEAAQNKDLLAQIERLHQLLEALQKDRSEERSAWSKRLDAADLAIAAAQTEITRLQRRGLFRRILNS